jgi:hypothetical protein
MAEISEQQAPVDMSPAAIAQRLRDLQQLYRFSLSLIHARFVDGDHPTAETHPRRLDDSDGPRQISGDQ